MRAEILVGRGDEDVRIVQDEGGEVEGGAGRADHGHPEPAAPRDQGRFLVSGRAEGGQGPLGDEGRGGRVVEGWIRDVHLQSGRAEQVFGGVREQDQG